MCYSAMRTQFCNKIRVLNFRRLINKSVIITLSFTTYTVKVLIGVYRYKVSENNVDCRVLDVFKGFLHKACNT